MGPDARAGVVAGSRAPGGRNPGYEGCEGVRVTGPSACAPAAATPATSTSATNIALICVRGPGGHVEPGEPVHQALAHELDEELGLDLTAANGVPHLTWIQDAMITRPGPTPPRKLHLVTRTRPTKRCSHGCRSPSWLLRPRRSTPPWPSCRTWTTPTTRGSDAP
ncbi:NUDIX domain-containing protein [Streptomyces puniciscabiei]|uniref:NUDIX domain-containing protein n=1 Tax=Streptomyces puniciscabiei TaxID=164348 RepID=A0A542THG1_9ACTN|nr:NUDIX domain-containing protein [Streptomyces puniciscabiei]TQK86282.1 NUDIX domain-containing protein [Streptomyces puniciscabiei]